MKTIAEFDFVATLTGIIVSVSVIGGIVIHFIKKTIQESMEENNKEVKEALEKTNDQLRITRINDCKNYLVAFLADVENGERLSVEEVERAYEVYAEYTDPDDLDQNHYVKDQWERLMEPYNKYKRDVKLNRE